jgi:hypothetical protein
MPTYNPIYFDHSSPDFIPANPPVAAALLDPNRRDNTLQPQMTEAQWHAFKPRWSFSRSKGELESPYYMPEVDPREINHILSVAWQNHDKHAVKTIVLWLSPECVDGQFSQLKHYGFERAEHREKKIPQLCFAGPPVRWKE